MSPDADITPEVLCSLIEEKVKASFGPEVQPNMIQLFQIIEAISREHSNARTRTLFRERGEELGRLSTEVRSLGTVIAIELNGQELFIIYSHDINMAFYYKAGDPTDIAEIMRQFDESFFPAYSASRSARQSGHTIGMVLLLLFSLCAVLAPTVVWAAGETTNKQAEPSLLYLGIMLGVMAAIIISVPVKLKRKIAATYQAILLSHFANKFLNDKKDIRSLNRFIEAIQDFNGGTILYLDGIAFGRALGETMAWVDATLISLEKEVKDEGVRRHISGYLKALHSARFKKEKFFGVVSRYQDFSKFVDYWCRGAKADVSISQEEAESFTSAMREFVQAPSQLEGDGVRFLNYKKAMKAAVMTTISFNFLLIALGLGMIASIAYIQNILLFFIGALLFYFGAYPAIEDGTDSGATEEAKEKIEEVFGQDATALLPADASSPVGSFRQPSHTARRSP